MGTRGATRLLMSIIGPISNSTRLATVLRRSRWMRFAASFDKRLIGLSGSLGQIKEAAAALGVSFEKIRQADAGYVVDHSSLYVLVEPTHRQIFAVKIAEPHLLAAKLIELLGASGAPLGALNNLGAYR